MSFPEPENPLTTEESSCGATATGEASAGGDEHEESVAQYMVALMERLHGPTVAGQETPPKRIQRSAPNPQDQLSTPARNQTAKIGQVGTTVPVDEPSERKAVRDPVEKRLPEST
ncbi:MAG: hypothetical protein ABSG53_12905, partial [Thermoguttaceae bacterium]